ncbi:F-box domain-containing protein [Favolaschia claudopus]|uniref:F-box domain-containing protein n=1 Tax=Favolaschia claudopus TaxID=2862362 RepID=A0AAW0AMH8_9AGAR
MLHCMETDREFVAEKDTQILELEKQIFALERSIANLRAAQQVARKRLNAYRYPVLTLPNEIVSEIFLHFLPPYPVPPPLVGRLSPFLLTHICHRWREISIATPTLWRAIDLVRWRPRLDLAALTALYVERARGCPLAFDTTESNEISSAIISYRSRWEHVKLHHASKSNWRLMFTGPMPRLRSLHILQLPSALDSSPISFTFEYAPLLRIVDMPIPDATRLPNLPWRQLTSLTLQTVRLHQLVSILQQSPDLIALRCYIHFQDGFVQSLNDIPCLRRLTSLSLDYAVKPKDRNLLSFFTVPALKTLEVPESLLGYDPIELIKRFMAKSCCHITELRVKKADLLASSYKKEIPSISSVVCERSWG